MRKIHKPVGLLSITSIALAGFAMAPGAVAVAAAELGGVWVGNSGVEGGRSGDRTTLSLGAPDADNGKKLIEFLLSKEAQGAVSSVALGMPVRKDVTPTDANFTKLHDAMQGVTIWTPDWAQVLKDLPVDVSRWKQATGS